MASVSTIEQAEPDARLPDRGEEAGVDARAWAWSLLGALLTRAPDRHVMDTLASIPDLNTSDTTPGSPDVASFGHSSMAMSWQAIGGAARHVAASASRGDTSDLERVAEEYHDLFIGVGRGELLPYASWYITGFLMDKPLSRLRTDLAALGYERDASVSEPEDHAGALCEVMAMLIEDDSMDEARRIKAEQTFFLRHIEPWMTDFFHDIASAKKATFYRAVGQFGAQFMDVEREYQSL